MGILNVTPDSFSDGGFFMDLNAALCQAREMAQAGAQIIDVGGESTRPGAQPVPVQQELDRVLPVIEAIRNTIDVTVSIDTSKPEVMLAAARAGAGMINDVYALRQSGALQAVALSGLPVCLMHMQGEPRTMQEDPQYRDVVEDVLAFLQQRLQECVTTGINRELLLIDPGFGFGKKLDHNLELLRNLARFADIGVPVVVGLSRKSLLGQLLDLPVQRRAAASAALALLAAQRGARILRVHDVAITHDVIRAWEAAEGAGFSNV